MTMRQTGPFSPQMSLKCCSVLLAGLCLVVANPVFAQKATCAICHTKEAAQFDASVHKSTLRCQKCHGGAKAYAVSSAQVGKLIDPDFARGPTARFDHGRAFLGKPVRKAVPTLCGTCHADVERMNPYGLRADELARYWTSGHGKALKQRGEERVAVCIDCHGIHDVLSGDDPKSRTYPMNIPNTCGVCHSNGGLMAAFNLSPEIVGEYRESVHGRLLLEQKDTGAPSCATCHGTHSAAPPGFASVSVVCGQCHERAAKNFEKSVHAGLEEFKGCVQCHGGGEGRHFHLIERITKPSSVMVHRYERLLALDRGETLTSEQVTEAIHPNPKQIITRVLPTCEQCHDSSDEDDSLPKLFGLLSDIAGAERYYVETANRLDRLSRGVLLTQSQQFEFQDAKTRLLELAPVQHALDHDRVEKKVQELNDVCRQVQTELDDLEHGLWMRRAALLPIWVFAVLFALVLYIKYKRLKAEYVKPLPDDLKKWV